MGSLPTKAWTDRPALWAGPRLWAADDTREKAGVLEADIPLLRSPFGLPPQRNITTTAPGKERNK
jgi:hypothetical protein